MTETMAARQSGPAQQASAVVGDKERYLFDLNGFLVLRGVLGPSEIQALHGAIDRERVWDQAGWQNDPNFIAVGAPHTAEEPIRSLIEHPVVDAYMRELIGPGYRYDHGHYIVARRGAQQLSLHGGGTPYDSASYFLFRDGRMFNGLVAVAFSLVDAGAEDGGFAAIPGSHKANYRCPPDMLSMNDLGPSIVRVPVKAGDAIIFTEALTHGTWPWTAEHERRAVFIKFSPGNSGWGGNPYPTVDDGQHVDYSERMRAILRAPYHYDNAADRGRDPVPPPSAAEGLE